MTTRIFSLDTSRQTDIAGEAVTLSLKELMPDEGGDVVILNQAGTHISVVTDDPVTAQGIASDHITRTGQNVSGFAYCRFAGGITMFYPRALLLCVNEEENASEHA